ncbi:ABC transporter substrate-binding protein [Roseovarius aestuarii]|nr:ABC transporter substrate-binding protein [Roseovarius aestuarii]
MLTRRRFLSGSAALAVSCGSSANAFAFEDALGNEIVLPNLPRRVITINSAMIESVFAIGAGQQVVGVGGKVMHPPEAFGLPSVGGAVGYSAEAVLALKPELVVMAVSTSAAAQLTRPMKAMNVPVFLASYSDFPSILRYIGLLGPALGRSQQAEQLVQNMQAQTVQLRQRLQDRPRLRVFLETGAAGNAAFQTVRRGHYANDSIYFAGGENVFSDLRGPKQVTVEGIAAADPDKIVVLTSDPNWTSQTIAQRPGWHVLRAVREGNVVVLPRSFMLVPGPRQAKAISILAHAIHPEAFAQ